MHRCYDVFLKGNMQMSNRSQLFAEIHCQLFFYCYFVLGCLGDTKLLTILHNNICCVMLFSTLCHFLLILCLIQRWNVLFHFYFYSIFLYFKRLFLHWKNYFTTLQSMSYLTTFHKYIFNMFFFI